MTDTRRLPLAIFVASHGGKSLLWVAGDAFALYVMVVLLRLPALAAGTLFLAASIWNAAADALWGIALARSARLRRRAPQIGSVAAVVACVSFAALPWLKPQDFMATAALFLVFRTAFALFDVPHNAVAATLAERHGHLRVMRLRTTGSSVAGLCVAIAAIPMLTTRAAMLPALSMTAIGALALVLLIPLPWLLAMPGRAEDMARTGGGAGAVTPPGTMLAFCAIHMVGIGLIAAVGKVTLHLDSVDAATLAVAPLLIAAMRLACIPLWSAVARRTGAGSALLLAYGACAASMAALPPALASGTGATIAAFAFLGVAMGGVGLLVWSVFSQTLAQSCSPEAPGAAALHYGLFTATMKVGLGGSAYVAGAWLASGGSASLGELTALLAVATILCGAGEGMRASIRNRSARGRLESSGMRALGFP